MNIHELGRFIAHSKNLRSIILLGGLVIMELPDSGGFEKLNALIPNLEDLHINFHYFTHQYALWDRWTYRNLRTLMLRNICFCVDNQFHSLVCLLRRTPALRKLVITKLCMELAQDQIVNVHLGPYLNAPLLNELHEVEIRNIHCVWRTISLLMFIFEQSPNLQHVTLSLEYVVPVEEQVVLGYFLEANLEVLDRNISFVVRYWPHQ